jgi:homoserine O-acetyltransferase/O-succinyltransferase
VRAQAMLVEALGIESLFLVIGAGLGGMQALQWASAYPKRAFACATIAAAARATPQAIALQELGRQAIMADPDWRGGGYLVHGVRPSKGLAIARAGTQIGNLSERDLRGAFELAAGRERFVMDGDFDTESSRQQGGGFVSRFDANSYLYLSRAMDRFDLAADFGGNLANAFQGEATRHGVFAFSSDWRCPPEAVRGLAQSLIAAGAEASYVEIDTSKGHDAYLGEEPAFEAALTGFIDAAALARGLSLQAGGR